MKVSLNGYKYHYSTNPLTGGKIKEKLEGVNDMRKDMLDKTTKTVESVVKIGLEIARSSDPFSAAVAVGGKAGIGAALSRISASQCAGLVGVIVSSITPQV